jgi:hypothetical protein
VAPRSRHFERGITRHGIRQEIFGSQAKYPPRIWQASRLANKIAEYFGLVNDDPYRAVLESFRASLRSEGLDLIADRAHEVLNKMPLVVREPVMLL